MPARRQRLRLLIGADPRDHAYDIEPRHVHDRRDRGPLACDLHAVPRLAGGEGEPAESAMLRLQPDGAACERRASSRRIAVDHRHVDRRGRGARTLSRYLATKTRRDRSRRAHHLNSLVQG